MKEQSSIVCAADNRECLTQLHSKPLVKCFTEQSRLESSKLQVLDFLRAHFPYMTSLPPSRHSEVKTGRWK